MPISLESSYCLDGAVTCLELTPDIAVGAFAAGVDVDAIVDSYTERRTFRSRGFAEEITTEVLNWRSTADGYRRAILGVAAMMQSASPMREFLWGITGPIAEDYLRRKGFPPRLDIYNNIIPFKELPIDIPHVQSLREPYVVEAVLDSDSTSQIYCDMLRHQYDRTVEGLTDIPVDDYVQSMTHSIAERRKERAEQVAQFQRRIEIEDEKVNLPDRRDVRRSRKSLRRGIKAMNQIVAKDAFSSFISKDGFVITGCLFDYHVSKKTNLLEHTASPTSAHIPYNLQIRNKAGEALGSGCIIFPNTPVLDQVIALTLHVRDQESEIRLVKTTNWGGFTQAAAKDKDFAELSSCSPITIDDARRFIGLIHNRYYRHRKSIMECIKENVYRTLSDIIGMPYSILSFMADPEVDPANYCPLIDTTLRFSNALLVTPSGSI